MSSDEGKAAAQNARDSLESLLDYYAERPASHESLQIGLRAGEVPSEEQAESLKKQLREAVQIKEIIDNLSPTEKETMIRMENISKGKRGQKGTKGQ